MYDLGMSYQEFSRCTYREYTLRSKAFNDSAERDRARAESVCAEVWKVGRIIAYMQSDGKTSIWDFLPLKGDPTPEEMEAAIKAKAEKDDQDMRDLLADLRERNVIK